jgi:hypothetical protein
MGHKKAQKAQMIRERLRVKLKLIYVPFVPFCGDKCLMLLCGDK